MKTDSRISKVALSMALVAIAIAAVVARQVDTRAALVSAERDYGFTAVAVGFGPQRKARLTLRNKGDEAVLVRLQFVDKAGKVLVRRDAEVHHGNDATLDWPCCGGNADLAELRAQFGTNSKRSIGLLMPTLEIIDDVNDSVIKTFGRESFSEFKPVFNPPLADAGSEGGPHE